MPVFSKYQRQSPSDWELFLMMIPVVRKARRDMKNAKEMITAKGTEYHLKPGEPIVAKACFNNFDKVIIDAPDTAQVDDTGYKEDCSFLKDRKCTNQYCKKRSLLKNFVSAEENYKLVRAEKRALFKKALGLSK